MCIFPDDFNEISPTKRLRQRPNTGLVQPHQRTVDRELQAARKTDCGFDRLHRHIPTIGISGVFRFAGPADQGTYISAERDACAHRQHDQVAARNVTAACLKALARGLGLTRGRLYFLACDLSYEIELHDMVRSKTGLRRPEFFTEQLYAALKLIDRGALSASTRGSMHGEVGQTQFMPKNVLSYGTGNLDVAANALNSTANFLKAHGWRAGAGYQPGEANFAAIEAWNAAAVYQRAIALMGRQIDGGEGTSAAQ
jgi:hypothetical protein